tara:strand:+ start:3926 stop:4345 length:420 start_codon:yes stop_codon:yes gene_type:complete
MVDAALLKRAVTGTCRFDSCREHMGSRTPYKGLAGERALALAVIHQAVKEMRDTGHHPEDVMHYGDRDRPGLRVRATVWLASTQAATWFEGCGLDHNYALSKIGWAKHARELMEDESIFLDHERARVLELGLDALGSTE